MHTRRLSAVVLIHPCRRTTGLTPPAESHGRVLSSADRLLLAATITPIEGNRPCVRPSNAVIRSIRLIRSTVDFYLRVVIVGKWALYPTAKSISPTSTQMINTYKGSGIVDNRWIIDSDSHITEPRDVWTAHVPAKWRDHVPYVVRNDKGMDVWMLEGTQIGMVGTSASGTNPEGQWVPQNTYEDCHPGASDDSCERLRYMDEVGIWAQVLYPNVAGFGSQHPSTSGDPELQIACVRA